MGLSIVVAMIAINKHQPQLSSNQLIFRCHQDHLRRSSSYPITQYIFRFSCEEIELLSFKQSFFFRRKT
ncbi:unnamed protein product [Rhizophagus irregularis]|nr:unnamed protein product [Rhizophagus irregularis]